MHRLRLHLLEHDKGEHGRGPGQPDLIQRSKLLEKLEIVVVSGKNFKVFILVMTPHSFFVKCLFCLFQRITSNLSKLLKNISPPKQGITLLFSKCNRMI